MLNEIKAEYATITEAKFRWLSDKEAEVLDKLAMNEIDIDEFDTISEYLVAELAKL